MMWYDTSKYDENSKRPFPIGKNKKVLGLSRDELGGRIMKEFCALRTKTYSYLMYDDSEVKKSKETKKCVIERKIMFENYTDCLFNDKIIINRNKDLEAIMTKCTQKKLIGLQ